jgi:protein involved in sex pheromone biosynthesis
MDKKIYLIIAIIVAVLAIFASGYFYWQGIENKKNLSMVRDDLLQTQDELQKNKEQLSQLRDLADNGLEKAKMAVALFKDSSETFLVAGDLKIAAISASEAQMITTKVAGIVDKQDKIALEDTWSKFLANMIQKNLENIY